MKRYGAGHKHDTPSREHASSSFHFNFHPSGYRGKRTAARLPQERVYAALFRDNAPLTPAAKLSRGEELAAGEQVTDPTTSGEGGSGRGVMHLCLRARDTIPVSRGRKQERNGLRIIYGPGGGQKWRFRVLHWSLYAYMNWLLNWSSDIVQLSMRTLRVVPLFECGGATRTNGFSRRVEIWRWHCVQWNWFESPGSLCHFG